MQPSYTHLTTVQRCQIFALKQAGNTQSAISSCIGISQGTVSRELRRNRPAGSKEYCPAVATELVAQRMLGNKRVAWKMDTRNSALVEGLLTGKQWSPEQISGRIQLEHGINISHETIYKHIWANKKKGGTLYLHLRQSGKKRNKRGSKNAGRGLIPNRRDIAERPKIVEEKTRLGDWELDSIIGSHHQGAITSMVERTTKFTHLALLAGPTKEATSEAIIKALENMKHRVLTLTSDNGREFAGHQDISAALNADFFFATPYHSWERGLNENTNGLVRQYFPKGTNFATITHEQVQKVQDLLNNRPRKTLKYLTPNEAFALANNKATKLCTSDLKVSIYFHTDLQRQ